MNVADVAAPDRYATEPGTGSGQTWWRQWSEAGDGACNLRPECPRLLDHRIARPAARVRANPLIDCCILHARQHVEIKQMESGKICLGETPLGPVRPRQARAQVCEAQLIYVDDSMTTPGAAEMQTGRCSRRKRLLDVVKAPPEQVDTPGDCRRVQDDLVASTSDRAKKTEDACSTRRRRKLNIES